MRAWRKLGYMIGLVALFLALVTPAGAASPGLVFPIPEGHEWRLTSPFGYRVHPTTGQNDFHQGVDLGVPMGTPIRAVMGGKVLKAGYRGAYGWAIEIDHGQGVTTLYGHLRDSAALLVSVGQVVSAGDIIGLSGNSGESTGPHLHFEVRVDGQPVDPAQWFSELGGGEAEFGIGPLPGGSAGLSNSAVAGLVTAILGGLRGEINQWLVGVFLGLLFMILLPSNLLTNFNWVLESIRSGEFSLNDPTVLYPWRIDVSGGASGLAVTIGVILWLFAVLRGARRMVEGEEHPMPILQALGANLALVVAAPLLVRVGAGIYNGAYRAILDALPEPVQHNTAALLWALLGLETAEAKAAFFALAALGFVTVLTPVSGFLAQVGQVTLGFSTIILTLWAIVLVAVGVQVLFALLFLGATPALVWIFGLFGDSWKVTTAWLMLVGRALLAAGATVAAGALWMGFDINHVFGSGFWSVVSSPILSSVVYAFLAIVLWSLWTRPALLTLYTALPAAGQMLVGAGAAMQRAGRVVGVLPGGQVLGPALVGAGGTVRQWGQATGEWQKRAEPLLTQSSLAPLAAKVAAEDTELRGDPLSLETEPGYIGPDELPAVGTDEQDGGQGAHLIRRRIRVRNGAVGDLVEQALRKQYGNDYEKKVRREDPQTFVVPADFDSNDRAFQVAYRGAVAGKVLVARRHGVYYAYVNGTWTRVPPRWAEAENAVFLGDLDLGGRR